MSDSRQPDDASLGRVTDMLPTQARKPLGAFRVTVVAGDPRDVGTVVTLRNGTVVVGSAQDTDLRVRDRAVSRRHLELALQDDGVLVEDMASTNGTFHLSHRVHRLVVGDGARIQMGATILEVSRELSQEEMEPASIVRYGELIGESLAMRRLFALLQRLETKDVTVLLQAETGTGKELVARALHDFGLRKTGPFVVFDCGAVAPELVESELFGHARGAFTGAATDRQGVFEQAHGGTLLLDEVAELPLGMQTRLLRALERGEVKRVGENAYRRVDVRIIAATHRDLEAACAASQFRSDLYYRLAVVKTSVPSLDQRRDDIGPLANHFVQMFGRPTPLRAETIARLVARSWPGNVRELRNAVQRMVALGEESGGEGLEPPKQTSDLPYKEARERIVDAFEERYVRDLMERHDGNITAAARDAQMSRKHLHELLRKHGL